MPVQFVGKLDSDGGLGSNIVLGTKATMP